jgi:hypothetical protein
MGITPEVPVLFLMLLACSDIGLVTPKSDDCEARVWYADDDGDGFGGGEPIADCEAPVGYIAEGGDCDDADPAIHPLASELCNGLDDDCDGAIDQGLGDLEVWYADADGDGFGGDIVEACEQPPGAVEEGGDCDDGDAAVNPAALEVCNDIDDDCDGTVDVDAADMQTWYRDADGDGYGVESPSQDACSQPSGYTDNIDDCDDADATLALDCDEGGSDEPVDVSTACSGATYRFHNETGEPELIVLSLYEADGGHGGPPGTVTVDIRRATEMTLVLSSYEPVDWQVSATSGAVIHQVLLNGYHSQTATVPTGVPVQTRSYDQTSTNFGASCGYSWPYAGGGCDTNQLIAGVETHTGLTTTEFAGCYHGTGFTVR